MGGRRWGAAVFSGLIAVCTLGHFPESPFIFILIMFQRHEPKGLPLNVYSWETRDQFSWMLNGKDIGSTLSLRF